MPINNGKTIGNASGGEDSSVGWTEKFPVTGSMYMLLSTLRDAILSYTGALTNKTIGNTNTITVKDANLTIQDDSDTTKQMKFQASGITAGQTRTITVPDTSDTMVTLQATQALTNKTVDLASNTLTGTKTQFNTAVSDGDIAYDAFKTIAVSGQSDVVADSATDTLTLAAGSNITITTNAGTDTITIAGAAGTDVSTDAIWDAKGDLAGGTGANTAARLAVGANGTVLTADSGETTGMKWATVAGTGDVVGPGSATDNAITRFDSTTGKLIQNSVATIDDSGSVNIPTGQTYKINGTAHSHTFTYPEQVIVPVVFPSSSTGSFALSIQTATYTNAQYIQSSAAQNDYVEYLVLLQSGTWRVDVLTTKNTDAAIMTLSLDAGSTSIGTLDGYNAASPLRNQILSLTGVSVASTGVKNFRITAATKNASSSNYYLYLISIVWTKTA